MAMGDGLLDQKRHHSNLISRAGRAGGAGQEYSVSRTIFE